uniref:ANK_REP_REGION domain-containing protein n=1 Tax=Caenorhabditis japonica TaxID=281687 RepID=A0A8R1EPZ4_CAEJA
LNPSQFSPQNDVHTPLDIAARQNHDVVVEYLTKLCSAKSAKEFTPEYIEDWKTSFETMVAEAKKKRNQRINEKKKVRRPSTSDGMAPGTKNKEIADVGVNTSQRNTRSADSNNTKRKYSKSTSVTNLMEIPSIPKQELEALKESLANGQEAAEEDDGPAEMLDVDEEFE